MRRMLVLEAGLILFSGVCLTSSHAFAQSGMWVTAYYAGWMQGQFNNGTLPAEQIDYSALTHIIHFAILPRSDGSLDTAVNDMTGPNSAALLAKAHASGVKVIVCIGGWGSEGAFQSATSLLTLPLFVINLVAFVRNRGYDGIDIDWEPLTTSDIPQFTLLIQQLRVALGALSPGSLLTAAVTTQAAAVTGVINQLDRIQVMNYDLSGAYPGWVTWHNSPLYNGGLRFPSTGQLLPSSADMVAGLIAGGVPAQKLSIGIPFYGTIWSGGGGTSTGGVTQPGQSWTVTPQIQQDVPYSTIMRNYYQPQWSRWDSIAQVPYLSIQVPDSSQDKFISYDDERSIFKKVEYARNNGFGEVFIWELGGGYRTDLPPGNKDQLLQAVKQAVNGVPPPIPSDTTSPVVSILSPNPGDTISGTVSVSAQATDNVAIAGVLFLVDGGNLPGGELTAPPFSLPLNTMSLTNGQHVLTARARDAAGNTATASRTVIVSNKSADTIPPAVTLSSPADGANVSGVVSLVALATDNSGIQSVTFQIDQVDISKPVTLPPYSFDWNSTTIPNGAHVLSAIAIDQAGNRSTASVHVTVSNPVPTPTPTPPTPISPTDGATGVPINTTITWSAPTGALQYHLVVASDSAFANIIFQTRNLTIPNTVVSGLSNGVTYFWKVSAINTSGESLFSTLRKFTTVILPPPLADVPVLMSPADGASNLPLSVPLSWAPSARADHYNLLVSADSSFTNIVSQQNNLTIPSTNLSGLLYSTTYFWEVSAVNGGGESAFSHWRRFTTTAPPPPPPLPLPAVPVLDAPPDAAANVPIGDSLRWFASANASLYHIMVATDSTFSSVVFQANSLTMTSTGIPGLLKGVKYFWKVSAIGSAGESPYSSPRSFTTIVPAPAPPILLSPADGARGLGPTPTLSWYPVSGALFYGIQLSTDPAFATIVFQLSPVVSSSWTLSSFLPNGSYYWRVNAENAGGISPNSVTRTFSTGTIAGIVALSGGTPEDFSLAQNYPNPFNHETWIQFAVPEASHVTIRIIDLLGRTVSSIVEGDVEPGTYRVRWDGSDRSNAVVASGFYVCTMIAMSKSGRTYSSSRKIVLMK